MKFPVESPNRNGSEAFTPSAFALAWNDAYAAAINIVSHGCP